MRRRYWRTYPATPTPLERRRNARTTSRILAAGLFLCFAAIAILFVFVLNLKAARDQEVNDRSKAIDDAMCSVLNQFHGTGDDFEHARALLHCPEAAS